MMSGIGTSGQATRPRSAFASRAPRASTGAMHFAERAEVCGDEPKRCPVTTENGLSMQSEKPCSEGKVKQPGRDASKLQSPLDVCRPKRKGSRGRHCGLPGRP